MDGGAWQATVHGIARVGHNLALSFFSFSGGSIVKNLPAVQKTWVRSLGQEDPLEKGMAAHSSILAWIMPWTEEPSGPHSPWGCEELDATELLIYT